MKSVWFDAGGDYRAPDDAPPIRFAQARGARIAYQDFGQREPIVIAVPPLAQNLEIAFEAPLKRAMFARFAAFSRWIQFDKRGTGSSDRRVRIPGIDERVDDMRAVMDSAGVERAHLFGQSGGGPTAVLFAVTYPERVDGLILFGSGARVTRQEHQDDPAMLERSIDLMTDVWGSPELRIFEAFAPSLANDPGMRAWWPRYERAAADRDSLRELIEINSEVDVSDVLEQVAVPTLVVHRVGDAAVPIELGREVAERIPGAELVELPGDDHYGFAGDMDAWVDEVERFVTGSIAPKPRSKPAEVHTVDIVTLGRFTVVRDGQEVPTSAWGSRRARTLCKRLVAARGWPVAREELIELLWPDETDMAKLGGRLSVQLSAVRRILGGGVAADRATVALDLREVSTDVETLFNADDDAQVVAAYGGEFLPEDRYDDWTMGIREELRTRFRSAARRMTTAALDEGDAETAATIARQLISDDEHDEEGHRLLVDVLTKTGSRRDARRAYDRWVNVAADLAVSPPSIDLLGDRADPRS